MGEGTCSGGAGPMTVVLIAGSLATTATGMVVVGTGWVGKDVAGVATGGGGAARLGVIAGAAGVVPLALFGAACSRSCTALKILGALPETTSMSRSG